MNLYEKYKSRKEEKRIRKEKEDADPNKRETWSGELDFFLATLGYAGIFNKFKFS